MNKQKLQSIQLTIVEPSSLILKNDFSFAKVGKLLIQRVMSDLAKDLLSQYYGLGADSRGNRCLSIHRSVENAKNEEEKQVAEQASLTNEENASDEEVQKDEDENRKLSIASESYRRSSRVLDSMEDACDSGETFDLKDIDFGPNIMCNIFENVLTEQSHEQLPEQSAGDLPSDCIKPYIEDREINEAKNNAKSDLDLSFVEDTFTDNTSDASSTTAKESRKSSKSSASLPPLASKKQPVCNEVFLDFSSTDLKQFPGEILSNFSQLRMLYLSNNNLIEVPGEVFSVLKYLEWLDVRNNQLSSLPASIKRHTCLQTILLQQNKVEYLPLELCTLPNLRTLQVTQNPLVMPPKDIVASGCAAILTFLRIEWNNAHPEERVEPKESKIEPKLSTILCYQSPRKKKLMPLKDVVPNRNVSTREKRKLYKPSNRYFDEKSEFLNNHWLEKTSKSFYDFYLQKTSNYKIHRKLDNNKRTFENINTANCKVDTDELENKILRLMGPSPRSLYVRQNVKTLKTYHKSMEKECRIINRITPDDSIRTRNNISRNNTLIENSKRCENKGPNIIVEHRLLWFSKLRELFARQTAILQKVKDINKKINELLESLNKLEINTTDEKTPRTKQNLFKNEIEK
ncbi:unnamed protein product, partial [Heterotrigona itama]